MLTDTVWMDQEKDLLCCIDQTKLPNEKVVISIYEARDTYSAIKRLAVRGAPAIGVAAAIGLYAACVRFEDKEVQGFLYSLNKTAELLNSSRPTAVNLSWALKRMLAIAENYSQSNVNNLKAVLKAEALNIYNEDIEVCRKIGENGLSLLKDGSSILTHCNAGSLAAVRYGTALAPIYIGKEKGYNFKVYADETRPLLQGARLTAYELCENGIDTTLICDNMSASLMQKGMVDAVLVGCDRVAANGDTANKIGTLGVALIAKAYSVPFYVCAPYSTIDYSCKSGEDIIIEQRDASEVMELHFINRMTHPDAKVYNPAFDVTPAELITAFITEKGVFSPKRI
ncbi:MAG: S-methyl-5-thioribose-1-phosphate isomerase [Clostridiales bacterium GWF2_36_10]|nr:MAG: S-methyl-5-thioribose-1-phosphate isomerase [Clostridiales bacterium GWF2_36_10]HAN21961.1 S-methyl-5-thioribose-1-phosphate isomerase [Clostridiales bacterium]